MAGTVKGIIVEIGGDTSGLQKALSKVNSATASLSKELRGINSLLKLDPSNTTLLAQKQEVLSENIETTTRKLMQLQSAQETADATIKNGGVISQENYRSLQREIVATENKLKLLKAEASKWNTAGDAMTRFGTKIMDISNIIDKMGTTLTTRLTLPAAALATVFVNSAKEFETAFTGVEKTVDGTAEQMANLKQGIKDMSEVIPSSTTEISAVAEAAGQLGIQTDNVLSFTKAMIDMGNSTNLTSEDAASSLARFANITQMSQKDFERLGSSIVDLGNNFATTESDIVDMGLRLAGAGHQIGMSEGQILGLATALSSVGIEAEMGGSAMSKAMIKMQNAVELGGGKLTDVIKKTGMTLKDLELMSANDSKGFKELSQSIGMTSTEVKSLITAGTNLEDFASVSGMTVEQFKKAWKEDATGALTAFIKGLGSAQDKGQSAITMLSEMGLTEVRLRDSLLRAANAGDLFNNAIETGTKAWNENVALTNEANKRYETLDSRIKMTTNKLKNLSTNMGDKLTPGANKLLDKFDGLIEKLDSLDNKQTENLIKIVAFTAAIGPAIKIIGIFGKTTGNTITTLGNFAKAIANVKNGVKTAEGQVGTFTKILSMATSPLGIATLGITAMATAFIYFETKETEAQKAAKEFAEEMKNSKAEMESCRQKIDENTYSNVAHIESVKNLRKELNELVDENGKVKEGYEGRVSFILNELNSALGTEYKLNKGIIENYQDLQNEIDSTIEKKKAQIILQGEEEKYKDAIDKQTQAVEDMRKAQENLGMSYEEAKQRCIDYNNAREKLYGSKQGEELTEGEHNAYWNYTKKEIKSLEDLVSGYEDAESKVKTYTDTVNKYADLYAKYTEGKYDEISNTITITTEDWTSKTLNELNGSITEQSKLLDMYKNIYDRTGNEIALKNSQQAQQNLDSLASELAQRTQTLSELGQSEIDAWKNIATQSYSSYSMELSKMSPEMQQKIQDATGVIAAGTPQMQEKADELGRKTIEEFDKSSNAKEKALNTITGYLRGLDDDTKRELLKQAGIENADAVLDELDRGDLSEENGKNLLEGLWKGLENGTWKDKILGAASGLAKAVNKAFTGKDGWDEHSPSKKMRKFAEYYIQPISDVMNSRKKKIVETARNFANSINNEFDNQMAIPQDFTQLQGNVSKRIVDNTRAIYTTPQIVFNVQELDEAKLNQCFNYINRKFGSKY